MDMKNLQEIMKVGQELQSKMAQLEGSLSEREVSASSGGGMVTATVDGKGRLKSVKVDPTVVDPADVEMLEDLVLAAVSEAQAKAQTEMESEMQGLAGGLPIPMNIPGMP